MTGDRMRKARGRGYAAATVLSLAVHVVVLAVAWVQAPKLVAPQEDAGPPEPIIPVLILPVTPPLPPGSKEKPRPIRLHRRQLHPELGPPPEMIPLVAEKAEAPPAAAAPRAPVQPRITVEPSPRSQIGAMLRRSAVGCANPALLSPEEREACLAKLGRGAHETPYLPPAMDAAKQSALQAEAAARDRAIREREGSIPAGVAAPGASSGASNRNKPLYTPTPPPLRP
jgi:hypothetical protein